MKKEYWDVTDDQIVEKSGKNIQDWIQIIEKSGLNTYSSKEIVDYLQNQYNVPRYWARTLTTIYIKQQEVK